MKKDKQWILYLFISLIVVFFTAMLVLCGMYLDLRLNGVTSSLPEIPENDKWILTNSASDSQSSSEKLVSPAFIGIKNEASGMCGAIYDKSARETLNKNVEPLMTALFNGYAKKVLFDDDDRKNSFVRDIVNSDTYIYISLYNDLPSSVILPGFYGSGSYMPLNESFDVKYIFVLPDGDTVKGICFDSELNAVVLSPIEHVPFNNVNYSAYNELSGFASFEFVSETYPEPVFTESFEVSSVMLVPSFSFYKFDLDDIKTVQLLKTLDFNPNLVKSYAYNENSVISFVGEEKELYVSLSENTLYYNGFDKGIHLSEFLKYYPRGDGYTLTDTVLCVKYLMNSIDRILVGGDALPTVVGVSYNGSEIVFKLKYFYNGIAVTEKTHDVSVSIAGEYIKSIEAGVLFCDSGNLSIPVIPQKLALNALESENEDDFTGYGAMLKSNVITGMAEFVWVARKDVE